MVMIVLRFGFVCRLMLMILLFFVYVIVFGMSVMVVVESLMF